MISNPASLSDLIPEYVQGTLDPETTTAFAQRLAVDQELRRELDEFLALKMLYRQTQDEPPPPSEKIFQRIDAAISGAEAPRPDHRRLSNGPCSPRHAHLAEAWARLKASVGLPWGLAVVQAALIVILLIPGQPDHSYQTLSTGGDAAIGADGSFYNIVFSESASEARIRTLLINTNASIIAGPSAEGRYRIVLPDGAHHQEHVARLRRDAVVRFLEPVME